jgi:hypothetical protein
MFQCVFYFCAFELDFYTQFTAFKITSNKIGLTKSVNSFLCYKDQCRILIGLS